MKIIQIHHPYKASEIYNDSIVLALGFFDGVHRGHQKVIKQAKEKATALGIPLAVMTFNHHPSIVFRKKDKSDLKYITTNKVKAEIMASLGVDILYIVDFTSAFASLSPQAFVDQYIVGLNAKVAVAGFDYTYGPADTANMTTLLDHASGRFEIITIEKESVGEEKISSTAIRQAMKDGNMEKTNHYLGYYFTIIGKVIHGLARGREIGYPTANIEIKEDTFLPRVGVYVVSIQVNGKWHWGMASIGYNITFGDNNHLTVEVNILDFDEMIYGEEVHVRWHHYLRDELKFNGVDELIAQLELDEQKTREYGKTGQLGSLFITEV